jgi:amino acid transporter
VVLTIAISTTLLSYLFVFPAVLKLRYAFPHVRRPYVVPFGKAALWTGAMLTTIWIALGSFEAVFPGVLEPIFGVDYGSFVDAWGVSRAKFEALTLGTLGVIMALALTGYWAAERVRRQTAEAPLEVAPATVNM